MLGADRIANGNLPNGVLEVVMCGDASSSVHMPKPAPDIEFSEYSRTMKSYCQIPDGREWAVFPLDGTKDYNIDYDIVTMSSREIRQ